MLKIFPVRSDKHISHEKCMVGTSAYNPDLDLVFLVPSCKAIDDIDTIVQVIDCSLTINSPDLINQISIMLIIA